MKTSDNKTSKGKLLAAYKIAEQWKSDLEFYNDEVHFLASLVDKNFVYLIDEKEFPNTTKITNRLKETINVCQELLRSTLDYMVTVGSILEKDAADSVQDVGHVKLEIKIAAFENSFKSLKREIFSMSKVIMKHEKMKRLLQAQ